MEPRGGWEPYFLRSPFSAPTRSKMLKQESRHKPLSPLPLIVIVVQCKLLSHSAIFRTYDCHMLCIIYHLLRVVRCDGCTVASDFRFCSWAKLMRAIIKRMTGHGSASKWQDKHLRVMENLVHNPEFQRDIIQLNNRYAPNDIYALANKYNVQPTLLIEYLEKGAVSQSAVSPSLSIICDEDETAGPAKSLEEGQYNYIVMRKFPHRGIELFIPPGTSQIEISSFIKDHWDYIERKIGKPARNKRQSVAARNAQIIKLHRQGLSNGEILKEVFDEYPGHLTTDDIGVIIRKNK